MKIRQELRKMENKGAKNTLYQAGDLEYFAQGNYEGLIPSSHLKKFGDTGIGTFHCANGEMIVLEGVVYQAAWNGTVNIADDMTTPLANVKFFNPEIKTEFSNVPHMDRLTEKLMEIADSHGTDLFYVAKISGFFSAIQVRSAYPQTKPFKPLEILLETDEVQFDYENLSGTIIGLYCPESIGTLNHSGWHFHFISEDRKKGGHLLDAAFKKADVQVDFCHKFEVIAK